MARLLALDWDHQQLHVVAATTGARLRVQHAVVWPEPRSLQPDDAELIGKQLRERLKAAGIAAGNVVACLGRDRVILKEVRYPAASPADEPAIVRFQAAKELTDSVDDVIIDYVPLGQPAANGERRAFVLAIRKEVLTAYQTLCRAAGLKLAALSPRPLGTLACWKQLAVQGVVPVQPGPDHAVAILTLAERWGEFCVVRGDGILFTRAFTPGAGLVGEVRRNLAVYTGQWSQHPLSALVIAGGEDQAALRDQLQGSLSLPVHLLDPFAAADRDQVPATGLSGFTGAVGLLYAEAAGGQYAINFVHPKQAQAGSDSNKRRFVLAGAAAAVLLVGAVALGYSELSARDRDIQRLLAEKTDLDRQNRELLPDAERIKALDEWTKTQVNWLDELYDMTDRVPDTEALRLTEFLATSGNPQGRTAREKRGHITLKGVARGDNKAIDYLRRQIESESTFHNLEPSSQAPNRTTFDRQRFPVQFSTGASVEARPPAKYVRELEESTTRRPVRRNGGEQPATEATGTPAVEGGQP